MSESVRESAVLLAWSRSAKGHGLRWRMLRDVVAVTSLAWMTTMQVQICLRRLHGLKNKTTRDILEELEQERTVKQEKDDKMGLYKWGATDSGVAYWIGSRENIPVGLAVVASTTAFVLESEQDTKKNRK